MKRPLRWLSASVAALGLCFTGVTAAHADDIYNNLDATIDATAEIMPLNVGSVGTTTLLVKPVNGDGKNGCNLTGSTTVEFDVKSSSPAVATVNPSRITFTSCSDTQVLTVTAVSAGSSTISLAQFSNNTGGSFDTRPATFTVNVTGDTTPPVISYAITPATPDGGAGWYRSNVTLTWTVTDPESAVTKVGCVDQIITADQPATTYSCSASSAGGSAGPVAVTVKRDATAPSLLWAGGPSNAVTYVYGAVPSAPTCTAVDVLSGPASCVLTGYSAETGTHTMVATAKDVAGNILTESRTYSVRKASSSVTVTCPSSVTYTGSAHEPCTATVTGAGGLSQSVPVSYTDNTGAGTATASASYAGDANHDGSTGSATFTIDKAGSTVTVTCSAGPFVYTGEAHTPCTATVTGAGGLSQSVPVSYTDNTGAGTATASASYDGDANHLGSSDSKTFEIAKASSSVTVSCPESVTYTGSAQEPCSATVGGIGMGVTQDVTWIYTDNVNAGTATASASYDGDANHLGSSDSKTFEIAKASSSVTVSCPESVTYTGSAQEPCTASVSGAGGLSESLSVSYANNLNAGTATASASYAGDANHLASSGYATFTIDKAPSTVTVTCPASVVFTGSPITPCTAVATGVGGLSVPLTVTYVANTAVGTATASATYGGDANHLGSTGTATFQIAAWTLNGFYQPVDMNSVW
ncbi:MAG: hypothetical protein KBG77_13490, partial [Dermatophilaceae bacterium]|nr:hypothetical protein [Dermatophilaceae bacterium]